MGVGPNTYGTVARVQARVGDLVDGRVFSTGTVPTLAQVEVLLDDVAARINMELRAMGYTVPVVNVGTDVEAFEYLRAANSAGAAALVLNTVPGELFDPDSPEASLSRRWGLWAELNAALKYISKGDLPASRTITVEVTKAWAGSQEDDDGNTTTPAFTRERTSYPGAW